jgi:P27 family predicted phage terminase small subunit
MGRRGRLPDPNSGRSQAALARVQQIAGPNAMPAPAGFSAQDVQPTEAVLKSPAARDYWTRNAPILVADGRLRPERVDAFAILCRLHSDIEQLADQVAEEGWITATERGQAISPVAKLLRDARRDFVALARDFGLTAAAAARMPQEVVDADEEDDDTEAAILAKLSVT